MIEQRRLAFPDVARRAFDHVRRERLGQRQLIDHGAAGGVHQHGARIHQRQLACPDQVTCPGSQRDMQGDRVGAREQLIQFHRLGARGDKV